MKKVIRKRNILPIVVLVLGILLGGTLIGVGIRNNVNSDYDTFHIKTEDELKSEISNKIKELDDLKQKRDDEYDTSAISEEYEKLCREISAKEGEILDAEATLADVKNGFYDNMKQDKIMGSIPLIIFGAVTIVFTLGLFMKLNSNSKKNVILTVTEEK